MKVIGVTEFGGPEKLGTHEVPEPHAGPGEVRIRVHAAAVSPTDTHMRIGDYPVTGEPPYVPGMDAAGVVDEVGEGCPWQVGDKLMAIALPVGGKHGGGYVEKLVGPWRSMARIPEGVDFAAASTLPMNGLTAYQALEKLDLSPGQTLAVTGAAGTLGGYVVQLAKHRGLTVVADAAEKDRELVASFGADHIVPRGDDVASRIREIYPDGVDGLVDGSVQNELVVPAVRDGGGFATVRFWSGPVDRGIKLHKVLVAQEYESHEKLDELRKLVEEGVITLRVADTIPADNAAEAHRRLAAGGVRGRLVLTF